MIQHKIFILEPEKDQSITIAKFLRTRPNNYFCIGVARSKIEGLWLNRYYDKILIIKSIEKIPLSHLDIIVPTGIDSTKELLSLRDKIKISAITFNLDNLSFSDKIWAYTYTDNLGIPIPDQIDEPDVRTQYPIFYKDKVESGSHKRGIIHSYSYFRKMHNHKSYLYQKLIESKETYGVGFLAENGKILTSSSHKEIVSYPKTGGSAAVIQKTDEQTILTYAKKIISDFHYSGWGLVEFKYDPKRDEFLFLELNPKFWASIEFSFLMNPDFLKLLFNLDIKASSWSEAIFRDRLLISDPLLYMNSKVYFPNSIELNKNRLLLDLKKSIRKKYEKN